MIIINTSIYFMMLKSFQDTEELQGLHKYNVISQ